jgi:hypothetical protein
MNISEAKKQIKYAVISYLTKDEYGGYVIPVERQRPLFLVGPPGVGKTEIVAQIADEMDIALVNYSMTHHTRQSALGLPFIREKEYGGRSCRTTEYTMSEIIASVYDAMEETGRKEGILFLDEINCISETLAPSMLQFLQFKTFGRHRVPDGWVVVTAGNPPEYNDAVREFDLATQDRLKRIDVEPDLAVWQKYAAAEGVHSSVMTYLEIKKDDFYSVRTTVDGKSFVTARGWTDLSEMIYLYEKNDLPVDTDLIRQYIRDERIARDFSAYYDMFYRYRKEYAVQDILSGTAGQDVATAAAEAAFDEKLTIIRLVFDALDSDFRKLSEDTSVIERLVSLIREKADEFPPSAYDGSEVIDSIRQEHEALSERARKAHSLSRAEERISREVGRRLGDLSSAMIASVADSKDEIRKYMAGLNDARREAAAGAGSRLSNAFAFMEKAFGDGDGMLVFVTALTEGRYSSEFISRYGSRDYSRYSDRLMLYEREQGLESEIRDALDAEEEDV